MNSYRPVRFCAAVVSLFILLASNSYADLIDKGNGIIDDTDANRMWILEGINGYSYTFPGFANYWINQLNTTTLGGGYNDWRLPTVDLQNDTPVANSGDLYTFYADMVTLYGDEEADRPQWPFTLGDTSYGGRIILTDRLAPAGNGNVYGNLYWGLRFGDGQYVPVDVNYNTPWVGVLAVRTYEDNGNGTAPVPEPATLILFGTGLAGLAAARRRKKAS